MTYVATFENQNNLSESTFKMQSLNRYSQSYHKIKPSDKDCKIPSFRQIYL